ncbi:LOW QUALITY PROTEIN: ATP-binding cassette (ABC) Superfamily [Phytophthora palmivora]|uniref:ATP-binding cassette (ABC) Superfamily n=1 Tax=Phytophthora palmivora TaxID=4796 RepID=A0A2P4XGE7_9STRA|nr:LOW QUALITY PROTEIN: ATP-binding cassette (ABC) Superfamily [Phytophthora palmivora]
MRVPDVNRDAELPTTESKVSYESVVEAAFGHSQPQLEVRFSNLSVSCQATVLETQQQNDDATPDLPTIWNTLKHAVQHVVSAKKTTQHDILNGVSGVLRPGTMTLLLGQPGSGKSILLKTLSGRLRANGNQLSVSGEITYNGESQHLMAKQLPQLVAYVPQTDEHFPLLSVQETLLFAHAFSAGDQSDGTQHTPMLVGQDAGHHNREVLKSALDMIKNYPEDIKEQLGLQNCWNTVVGDNMVRGVSGGEKKRVTTGEMVLGFQPAVFMDEISTGLDSAATFDIHSTNYRADAGKNYGYFVAPAAPDVFELFDDVILLNEGEVMYYGPRDKVVDYFCGVGLQCPPNRDVADFLLDLGTPQQHVYEVGGGGVSPPRQAREFAETFQSSDIHLAVLNVLEGSVNHNKREWSAYFKLLPQFQRSVWTNTITLVFRQLLLIMRDMNTLRSRIVLVLVVAVVCSTAFKDMDPTNVPLVLGLIFQSAMFPLFEQTSQLSMFVQMRDVFYKQRSANFFQTSAYVLANVISQVPIALPESFVYGAFMYWIAGLEADIGRFILYDTSQLSMFAPRIRSCAVLIAKVILSAYSSQSR